jgi:O-antigen ligase
MQGHVRHALGAAAVVAACLFPLAAGPSPVAQHHLFAFAALACSATLIGFQRINGWVAASAAGALLLLLLRSGTYLPPSATAAAFVALAGLCFHTGARLEREHDARDFLVGAIVLAALINAVEGLLQYFGLAGGLWPWVPESLARGVAFGAFAQTNLFASFLCCGLVCIAWLLHNRRLSPSMAWFFVVLLELGIAASASRVGLLCIGALAVAGYIWRHGQSPAVTRLLAGNALVYAGCWALLPWLAALHGFQGRGVGARLLGTGSDSRWALWQNSIDLAMVHPWAGWGWGEFGYAHYAVLHGRRFQPGEVVDNAHNLMLHLAVEFGLPMALVLAALLLYALVRGKPWASSTHGQQFAWGLLLVIGIHSLVEYPLWSPHNVFLAAVAAGYLVGAKGPPTRGSSIALGVSAVVLVFLSVAASLQYRKVQAAYETPMRAKQAKQLANEAAAGAWMFSGYVDFARLAMMVNSGAEPAAIRDLAERLLHFSAEPAVIEPLLSALWKMGERESFDFHARRYCQAFPARYAQWRAIRAPNRDDHNREPAGPCS